MYGFNTRRSTGRITPTRKLVKKGSSLRDLRPLTERVVLEKVLGLTVNGNSGLTCNAVTGDIAYAAGCVIVIIGNPPQCQSHIVNVSRKTLSSLAFSPDGKFLVSGESGHQPAVRVWDVEDPTHPQVSEMAKGHKHGIQSVAFSPNMKYVVSVGFQHDMLVNIWNWREGTTIACNKVSSKVNAISFSENGDYFVTVGVRLVKFWYIDSNGATKAKKKIPLLGRPAILGEQRNNQFIDVACGLGANSTATYCVTKSGLLCSFNQKRLLDKWVELRVNGAYSLTVNEQYIFCGCSDGIIRLFNSSTLEFIGRLPKPHCLGVDVSAGLDASHLLTKVENATYPDTVALALDPTNLKLTCVYNDHSIYIWDIKDIKKIGKVSSFLYHNSCIWGIEVYPEVSGNYEASLPYGSFLTCSSDGTVRVWNIEAGTNLVKNIYSKELMRILYTEKDLACLKDTKCHSEKNRKEHESKPGVRCLKICHVGQQLATGDRMGNIRVFDLNFMDLLIKIDAHESEVICIEFSTPDSGYKFLGSAGRDRLIHVFDCDNNYNLLQTIDDHSASITAIKFYVTESEDLRLISCAADKSVIFRSLHKDPDLQFTRYTNVATKTTFYDMDILPSCNYTVTAGQDRNLRVFDISSGKQIRSFKGSMGDEGLILKVLLDKSGFYAATSCSDKSLSLYDFEMGECVAGMVGHSEIVTGLQFTFDCTRLITVSGDGCIFVWKLPSAFSQNMSERLSDREGPEQTISPSTPLRRETYDVKSFSQSDNIINGQDYEPVTNGELSHVQQLKVEAVLPGRMGTRNVLTSSLPLDNDYRFSIGKLPLWAKKQIANNENMDTTIVNKTTDTTTTSFTAAPQPAGKWGERFNQINLKIQPESPNSVVGESPERRRYTVDSTPSHDYLEALARSPLEKRWSNGSLNDEGTFFQDASVALRLLSDDVSHNKEGFSPVNTLRGSDMFIQTIETRTYMESDLANSSEQEDIKDDNKEEILYYPTEEDTSEAASKRLQEVSQSSYQTADVLNTNADIKPNPIKETQTIIHEPRTPRKKRSIEDYLRSPSESDDIGYFEIKPGHSMDDLVIHEVELASLARRRSEDFLEGAELKSYDVKIRTGSDDEKDLESQNIESMSRDDTDDKTADSLSEDEDLLTNEIIPKWDELSEEPAPTVDKADIEHSEVFLQENFECLGSTATDEKEESQFKSGPEAVPTEPLPFDRNHLHRTSISARFILRSKRSSARSTTSVTSQNSDEGTIEGKNLELEKRKEELALTKKRLETLGFTTLDKQNKDTRNNNEANESKTKTELTIKKPEPIRNANVTEHARIPIAVTDEKREHVTQELAAPSSRDHLRHPSPKEASGVLSTAAIPIPTRPSPTRDVSPTDSGASVAQNNTSPCGSPMSPVKVTRSPRGTVISSFEITSSHSKDTLKSPKNEPARTEAKISSGAFHPLHSNSSGEVDKENSPTKRASELIAFFDTEQKQKPTEHEANLATPHEDESKESVKNMNEVPKEGDASEKGLKNLRPSRLPLLSKNNTKGETQGRRSFLSNIRITKGKGILRRSSKGDLSKAKSCNDLVQEQTKKETTSDRKRRLSDSKEVAGSDSEVANDVELKPATQADIKLRTRQDILPNVEAEPESKEDVKSTREDILRKDLLPQSFETKSECVKDVETKPTTKEDVKSTRKDILPKETLAQSFGERSHGLKDVEVKPATKENANQKSQGDISVRNMLGKELPNVVEVSNAEFIPSKTQESNLSELSAELNAALATPQYQPIQINLSRDYLLDDHNLTPSFQHQAAGKKREFSSQITKTECREVVVDLVRAFERAMECHTKILQGDIIEDNQQQVLSMLSATFSTIQESVIECKRDREQKTRSPRSRMLEDKANNETRITTSKQTKEVSQQTEHSFLHEEHERIVPLLERYSELLLQKIEQKMSNK